MTEMRFINSKTGTHPFQWTPPASPPHIFLISIDMVPPEVYRTDSPYTTVLQIPHIRSLLRDSICFSNAFSVSPLCGPSRAAYLTGRYPYLTVNEERAHDGHAVALREEDAIFPEYLKAIGYHTRHVGKGHVGTALFTRAFGENDAAWNRWAPPITDDDGYMAYLRRLGLRPLRWRQEVQGLSPDRRAPGNRYGGWIEQVDGAAFPVEGTYSCYLAHRAVETLRAAFVETRHIASLPGRPIYLQLDFFAPHQPFMIPAGYEERAAALREVVTLPESYWAARARDFRASEDEPRIYEVYRCHWGLYDAETAREYILCNLLEMEVLDAAIGAFLDELKRQGLYDEALIVFLGDHGEMNGERALIDKGVYGHPKVARVPLAIKWPGGKGEVCASLVSLLDLAPTILAAAGVQPLERMDGKKVGAIQPMGTIGESPLRPLLFEAHWHVAPNPAVSLLWQPLAGRGYMYTYNLTSDVDELYNLADMTYRNLAADPAQAEVKDAMIRELGRVLSGDPRWRCYWHPLRLDKYAYFIGDTTDMQMFASKA